jgi:hypothetical protein
MSDTTTTPSKAQTAEQVKALSDDALLDAMREQINLSKKSGKGHNRPLTRALALEIKTRRLLS